MQGPNLTHPYNGKEEKSSLGWIKCFFFGDAEFKLVTKDICRLPSFFSSALFRKIDTDCTGIVTKYAVLHVSLLFICWLIVIFTVYLLPICSLY